MKKLMGSSRLLTSLLLAVAAVLRYRNIWKPIGYLLPVFAILQLLEGIHHWKTDRDRAACSIMMSGVIAIVSIGIFAQ